MQPVILRTFDNYFSANIILTRLQDAGFHCFLKDEYTVTIDPILSNAIGGIKLVVNATDAAAAQQILAQFDEEYMKTVVCPKCGQHNIISVPKADAGNFITAIFTWLFSSYAVAAENIYQCQLCGYETKTLPENVTAYN